MAWYILNPEASSAIHKTCPGIPWQPIKQNLLLSETSNLGPQFLNLNYFCDTFVKLESGFRVPQGVQGSGFPNSWIIFMIHCQNRTPWTSWTRQKVMIDCQTRTPWTRQKDADYKTHNPEHPEHLKLVKKTHGTKRTTLCDHSVWIFQNLIFK